MCAFEAWERRAKSKGLCAAHAQQRFHGKTLPPLRKRGWRYLRDECSSFIEVVDEHGNRVHALRISEGDVELVQLEVEARKFRTSMGDLHRVAACPLAHA